MESLRHVWAQPLARQLIVALIGVTIVLLLVYAARRASSRYIDNLDARYRARKLSGLAGYVAIAVVVLSAFSAQMGSFALALGAASAGIAFALQEVIVSFAGWLAISFGNFYKPGDRVELGGTTGDVIDIGLLRTTLMECGAWVKGDLYSGRIVRVANSFVFKEPVFNYSDDFPFLWDEIVVPIKFGSDHRLARKILEDVVEGVVGDYVKTARQDWETMVRSYRIENARIEPLVTMVANDNWIEFTVRYIVDYKLRRSVKDTLFQSVLDELDKTEGRVAMASMTVQLVEWPHLDVRLRRTEGERANRRSHPSDRPSSGGAM